MCSEIYTDDRINRNQREKNNNNQNIMRKSNLDIPLPWIMRDWYFSLNHAINSKDFII